MKILKISEIAVHIDEDEDTPRYKLEYPFILINDTYSPILICSKTIVYNLESLEPLSCSPQVVYREELFLVVFHIHGGYIELDEDGEYTL